ncbi:sigma-70 family RNA polymerase sigma factor [Verrucomicrobium sp. BvORR106]|uniref:sigma-70 family RNA polymerase sigma factor n=1 Tax=Verrucomicrobium sp. BvORR106 TaxID=1403819 RepID=UPI0005704D69|nr:sigma-70 family RNA polymerase sigma factor [Verrucomicrobium sp. BvORR106]
MKSLDPHVDAFESHRSLLTGVAYRMLGSVSDAEDMVQEAWLRWRGVDVATVNAPRSWLLTVVSRLCLDRLKSAQVQREQYFGTWLPEPLVGSVEPQQAAQVDESVSIALLLVLEKLSPVERAGFLLHEVFGHTFDEIGEILGKPAVNCRKLVSRARERVRADKPRFTATRGEHEELLKRFLNACRVGEIEPLMNLLGEDAALHSDGGGKAQAVATVLHGRDKIARFFAGIMRGSEAGESGYGVRETTFNGAPGVLLFSGGKLVTAMTVEVRDGKIAAIFAHRNPDKLKWFSESDGAGG